jgi:class 3 adenylate cyclase
VPARARFCPECGTALGEGAAADPVPLEERRTVSILFADLAGFTQRSDRADPEDVRRILVPFHELAKEEIERFGGTLDKFIGDAAMGVFGAPRSHEDDPERAVRAALAIRRRVDELGMPVRVAVNTGEAVVILASGPQVGENVAGDVVNTASRLQSVAPVGGVVVGSPTERATRAVVAYRSLDPVVVKGKAEPLEAWLAEDLREATPAGDEDDPPPFVGRERERRLLRELYERTVREGRVHLVTVIGEPGLGKSRLVADLGDHLRSRSAPVAWLRGRCLPYGESITYAAVAEIVRAALGIRAGDDRETERVKLAAAMRRESDLHDREWLTSRLAPLLGLGEDDQVSAETTVGRTEFFAAWTRFLQDEASRTPVVIVAEDLHWADEAMLAFLDHLAEAADDAPLLILATARPEIFTAHPTWGAGRADATTISLAPLSGEEMHRLLEELIERSALPDATQEALMARAGGNPLFALEYVHMLEDRGPTEAGDRVPVPESVQALIGARLDALAADRRARLQDASVVGDRFWGGALAALAPDEGDPDEALQDLQRRGLVRRARASSIGGTSEFMFAHALIRDVAYGRLPRAARAHRHEAVAAWLETAGGDAGAGTADQLAFHTTRALELARAAGLDGDIPRLEVEARRHLVLAGERQISLDAGLAADYLTRAVALTPREDPARAELLRTSASLAWRSGRMDADAAMRAYGEALELAEAAGDIVTAARVKRRLYFQLSLLGDAAAAREQVDDGIALVEAAEDPGTALAELYACRAEIEMFAGHSVDSMSWAARALEVPRSRETELMALHIRGNGRCELGDMGGLEDLRTALAIAEDRGVALDVVTSYSYLAEWAGLLEGSATALAMNDAGFAIAERRGLRGQTNWTRAERLWILYDRGGWDEILELAVGILGWGEAQGEAASATVARTFDARVRAQRGDATAIEAASVALEAARRIEDLQIVSPALAGIVGAARTAGDHDVVRARLREFDEVTAEGPAEYREFQVAELVRAAVSIGEADLGRRLIRDRELHVPRTRLAVDSALACLLEAEAETERAAEAYLEVAKGWQRWGGEPERAHALAGAARTLRAQGRADEASAAAATAQGIFRRLAMPGDPMLADPG